MSKRVTMSKNMLTFIGGTLALVAFAVGTVLIITEAVMSVSPYTSLVTYVVVPGAIGAGLGVYLLGMLISRRRRLKHQDEAPLPIIDLSSSVVRRRIVLAILVLVVFFSVSAVGTYRAYHFTETTAFCGTVCHSVMEPEFVAHQQSSHSEIACVECHVGAGAGSYLRAKLSGLRQVSQMVTGSWHTPIATPVPGLANGRRMCERCHAIDTYYGAHRTVRWHFAFDDDNAPSMYFMVMKVGGYNQQTQKFEGIHAHADPSRQIRYRTSSNDASVIPWVEVSHADGGTTVYTLDDDEGDATQASEPQSMDCIGCHNRVGHDFSRPADLVNIALASGRLDRSLPGAKRHAVELLATPYRSRAEARTSIAQGAQERFGPARGGEIAKVLTGLHDSSQFPSQKVSWRDYPNHMGHLTFAGCFRCHDSRHRAADGSSIPMQCDTCHEFVHQSHDAEPVWPQEYRSQVYAHPAGQYDMHDGALCATCHGTDAAGEPSTKASQTPADQ